MGWSFCALSHRTITEEVVSDFTSENDDRKIEILAHSIQVRKGVAYLAVKRTEKPSNEARVHGVVLLIKYIPKAKDGYTFGTKCVDECMGPYNIECPARILDLLTPLPDATAEGSDPYEDARRWRAACRERIAKQKANRKTMRDGATITLAQPVRFTDGTEKQTFTVRGYTKHLRGGKTRRAWRFLDANGCGVRLRKTLLASATIN